VWFPRPWLAFSIMQKGIINIKESTTMRTYLAQELHCPAMRISKKYHGNASMGLVRLRRRASQNVVFSFDRSSVCCSPAANVHDDVHGPPGASRHRVDG
jgi:hypothetical protein